MAIAVQGETTTVNAYEIIREISLETGGILQVALSYNLIGKFSVVVRLKGEGAFKYLYVDDKGSFSAPKGLDELDQLLPNFKAAFGGRAELFLFMAKEALGQINSQTHLIPPPNFLKNDYPEPTSPEKCKICGVVGHVCPEETSGGAD